MAAAVAAPHPASVPAPAVGGGGGDRRDHRVVIVGTGFSGLGTAIRLRQRGIEDFVVLERADEVGGTWRDNTYPGCSCDVQAHLYSFSFARNPHWKSAFGSQPEVYEYLRRCADDFGVRPFIRFGHELLAAHWDEPARRWRIETNRGTFTAQVLVAAMGYLSEPSYPDLPGLDTFAGTTFHSARWDHGHELTGRRVAVIGTGASAVQFVPKIQPVVGHLDVYQRTPPWIGPKHDKPSRGLNGWAIRNVPGYQRFRRGFNQWGREVLAFAMNRPVLMQQVQKNLPEKHLAASISDPELRARLTPDYTTGCKRLLFSDDYYPAITQPNVELVTDGIREVRPGSIVTVDGAERPVDTIIFGTGFRTTNRPIAERVWGRGGLRLGEAWRGGMAAYKGTTVAGFPNLFILLGPNTTLGHSSMTLMIEAQIAYVLSALRKMERKSLAAVDVRSEVQDAYNDELQAQLARTVWNTGGCRSWYLDAEGRNTTIWPTYTWRFRRRTKRFDLRAYDTTPAGAGTGSAGSGGPAVETVAEGAGR